MAYSPPVTSPGRGPRFRDRLSTGPAWTLADQGLSSGSNFLTFVLLARAMSPSQLGMYALAITGLYVVGNIQRALFIEPHYVYSLHQDDYRGYTTATATAQFVFAGSVAIIVTVAAWIAGTAGMDDASGMLLAFGAVSVPYLVQDFIRGIFFTESRFKGVFVNDLVSYGGQLVLILLLIATIGAAPVRALLAVGVSSGLAVIVGAWQFRGTLTSPIPFRATIRTNWRMGRWLSTSSVASAAANELYVFLSSGILGVAAAGAYRGVVTIVNVNNVFLTALIGRTLPRASERVRDAGSRGLDAYLVRLMARDALPIYLLSLLIIVFADQLLGGLYGEEYRQYALVLQLLAAVAILSVPTEVLIIGLKARGSGAPVLFISLLSAGITIAIGIPMMRAYGLDGVAYTMCLDVAIINVIMWTIYARVRRRPLVVGRAAPDEPADQARRDHAIEP